MTSPRPRVIQWGTGAIGAEMITAILDHRADLDLVGGKVIFTEQVWFLADALNQASTR